MMSTPSGRALHVGLTGNVASGKSTVARVWAEAGVPVISADDLARQVVAPGSDGLEEVVDLLGEEVRAPDGGLDRGAVRSRVFADEALRKRLEAILHPRIARRREAWIRAREAEGAGLLVSEVPLLFEAGLADAFDRIVVVHTSQAERRRRLIEDRGLDTTEAERIMASQGDPEEKRRRADHVLENEGTVAELEASARELLARLLG
jgi:dephospho-CoA kinase